ncbi:Zinc finger protein 512B [Amphibalanus amphitrite]|uniref:Zinc finger protein 512B n=1 Tax=Amphibalanus amphitrite TaxID=1232801 RepID=A0A6A4V5I2_AMPAM|nr:Zinc finger protein 512B [Amphibalanus amphitrite]
MELDTGATLSVCSDAGFRQLWPCGGPKLEPCSVKLKTYSEQPEGLDENIELADDFSGGQVDILIGTDQYYKVVLRDCVAPVSLVLAVASVSQAFIVGNPYRGFQTHHIGFKPVRHIVNHRPVPVPVPVPHKVYNPVPVYREVYSTAVNRVPVPVRVPRPVRVPVPVDVPRPVPVYRPVDVLKPVPVENHHLLVRKVGVPLSTIGAGYQPVRHVVNHRPVPVPVPVPQKVYNPVPVYREVYSTAVNRVPVPVRVPRPVRVPVPVDIPRPVPVPVPVNVPRPIPVQNHHFLLRKVGVPVSAVGGGYPVAPVAAAAGGYVG